MSFSIDALHVGDREILHNSVRNATNGYIPWNREQNISLGQHSSTAYRLPRRASFSGPATEQLPSATSSDSDPSL